MEPLSEELATADRLASLLEQVAGLTGASPSGCISWKIPPRVGARPWRSTELQDLMNRLGRWCRTPPSPGCRLRRGLPTAASRRPCSAADRVPAGAQDVRRGHRHEPRPPARTCCSRGPCGLTTPPRWRSKRCSTWPMARCRSPTSSGSLWPLAARSCS